MSKFVTGRHYNPQHPTIALIGLQHCSVPPCLPPQTSPDIDQNNLFDLLDRTRAREDIFELRYLPALRSDISSDMRSIRSDMSVEVIVLLEDK